jgi:hypothetical protein
MIRNVGKVSIDPWGAASIEDHGPADHPQLKGISMPAARAARRRPRSRWRRRSTQTCLARTSQLRFKADHWTFLSWGFELVRWAGNVRVSGPAT